MQRKERIAVIGAGIQGVCAALFLQKKGFNVTLFDRDEPGNAASYGNAGHFSPYASLQLNRTDILSDVPAMLLSSRGPLAIKWNYVVKMIPWFTKFILNSSKTKMMHTAKYMHQILNLSLDAFDELLRIVKPGGLFVLSINSKFFIKEGFKEKFSKIKNLISSPIFKKFSAHNKNINKTYNEVKIIACIFRKKL